MTLTRDVLLIATMTGVDNCAAALTQQHGFNVEVARNPREALAALRRGEYGVVVVEEGMTESNPEWADQIWEKAGFAIPLEVNFARSGAARIGRDIKSALLRRDGEHALARRAVSRQMEDELKSTVTGLLLQSELTLREPDVPEAIKPKLQQMLELAGKIRDKIEARQNT